MTTLEAIQLLKSQQPGDVSPEELAGLRELLLRTPSLYAALGGPDGVERFLAAADKVLSTPKPPPLPAAVAAAPAEEPADPGRSWARRRTLELSIYGALIVALGLGIGSLMPWGDKAAQKTDTARTRGDANAKAEASEGRASDGAAPSSQATGDEHDPPDIWRGWKLDLAAGAHAEKQSAWDLAKPGNPQPVQHLVTSGGRISLSRSGRISAQVRSVQLDCLQAEEVPAGEIQVLVDGKLAGRVKVSPPHTPRPLLLSLGPGNPRDVVFTLVHIPLDPRERLVWRNIEFSPEAADVLAPSGDPDPARPNLRLWLRADVGIKDSARRGPGTAGFDNLVQTWADQSSRHVVFTSDGDSARRPIYAPAQPGLAGKPAVTFDGVKQFLRYSGEGVYRGPTSTTFAVFDVGPRTMAVFDTSEPRYFLNVENLTGPKSRRHRRILIQGQMLTLDASGRLGARLDALSGRFVIATLQINGPQSFLEFQGAARAPGTLAGGDCGGAIVLGLPAAVAAAPVPNPLPPPPKLGGMGGSLAELLIYDRVLTALEIRQLGQYLQARYAIAGAY